MINMHSGRKAVAMMRMMGCNNGRYVRNFLRSDCAIEEKTVVLHKKENEGFGFVLRGAKADTPIEEFTPTPAFPALQYLESVDEGGVAWEAGLRTGDFLIEVNQENVVKVGHRQVVNMIRQGGNRLVIKVVTVTRNLDNDDNARKKAPPPPKRAPSTALSMRSKSMTSELEDIVDKDKVDEVPPSQKNTRDNGSADMRVATIKPRPSSRCLVTPTDFNAIYERQGVAVVSPTVPSGQQGPYLGVPKGTIKRQKSIGITEEEKQFLTPPLLKFTRSLSMPDTSEDIPPPPGISPPSPPFSSNAPNSRGYSNNQPGFMQPQAGKGYGNTNTINRGRGGFLRQNSDHLDPSNSVSNQHNSRIRNKASIPENPYSEVGNKATYVPAKPARRKGMLVKQPNVEDSPEKTCSIPIPTIIVKEPSTSSSGKSSQGSSMEIETSTLDHPGQLRPEDSLSVNNPFAAAIAGAVRDREKRLEARRNSPAFLSTDLGDEDLPLPTPTPRLRQSKSIDEGMFAHNEGLRTLMAPPASLLKGGGESQGAGGSGSGSGGNVTDFNTPEPVIVREPLNTRTRNCPDLDSPVSLPATIKTYSTNGEGYLHPVTGKALDPNSPLALALAARDRAIKDQAQPPPPPPKMEPHKPDINQPLFIDTKLRSGIEAKFAASVCTGRAGLRRQMTECKYEAESTNDSKQVEEKKNMVIDIVDTPQQKPAGLLMVHNMDGIKTEENNVNDEENEDKASQEIENRDLDSKLSSAPNSQTSAPSRTKSITAGGSVDEPIKLPFRIPPPPLASIDIDEEFVFAEPLPPPLEFANSIDIPEDQVAEILKQRKNSISGGALPSYNPHAPPPINTELKRSGLLNCIPPSSYPPPPSERFEPVTDSGIEMDSRSSGDPHLETTSTISTVSSISTLSSEGSEALDTCTVYADGQVFLVDRPPVPPKPKMKPIINKSNALYRDPLIEESPEFFNQPPPAPPPPQSEPPKTPTQRSSKLWRDAPDLRSPPSSIPDPKANVISELSSILQHMNREKCPKQGDSLDSPTGPRSFTNRDCAISSVSGTQRSTALTFTSPSTPPSILPSVTSPPALSPTPSTPGPVSSPAPTPPLCPFGSRSASPLSLLHSSSSSTSSSNSKPFSSKPVLLWSKHDVADWLESLNMAEHRDAFMENEIEGSHLPNLQKDDLIDLGVTRVGHRMNIERALKLLMDR